MFTLDKKFWTLIAVVSFFAFSSLGAQELRLTDHVRGHVVLELNRSNKGTEFRPPAPRLITDEKSWQDFLDSFPEPDPAAEGPDTEITGVDIRAVEQPDFSNTLVAVVFIDAKRKGPIRLDKASIKGKELVLDLSGLNWGLKIDDLEDGEYHAFFLKYQGPRPDKLVPNIKPVNQFVHRYLTPGEDGEKYGIRELNKSGWVLKPVYSVAMDFDLYYHAWVVDPKLGWVMIDHTGKVLYRAFVVDNGPDYTSDGLMRITDDKGKIGFINIQGKVVIAPQFDYVESFQNGQSKAYRNGKWVTEDEHRNYVGGEEVIIDIQGKPIGKWQKVN